MTINKGEFTCKEDIQQDAMQGPTQHYHAHWEFLPGECHACAKKPKQKLDEDVTRRVKVYILSTWNLSKVQ